MKMDLLRKMTIITAIALIAAGVLVVPAAASPVAIKPQAVTDWRQGGYSYYGELYDPNINPFTATLPQHYTICYYTYDEIQKGWFDPTILIESSPGLVILCCEPQVYGYNGPTPGAVYV